MKEYSTTKLGCEQIKIDGQLWEIREMTVDSREAYNKVLSKTMEIRAEATGAKDSSGNDVMKKTLVLKEIGTTQKALLIATMKHIPNTGEKEIRVADVVGHWGSKMVEELCKTASDLNGLDMSEVEKSKVASKN
jgi:hypothetical protein